VLFSCTNEKTSEVNEQETAAKREFAEMVRKDSMNRVSRDSIENAFRMTLDEINNNLHLISQQEGAMALNAVKKGDKSMNRREEILNSIADINKLLDENKAKLKKLNRQLATARSDNKRWKEEAERIQQYLTEKENEISSLKEQIAQQQVTISELNNKVSDLTSARDVSSAHADLLDKELHKAYFATGTYSQLKKQKVVAKEGGVLGIGRTQELAPNADKSAFTEIDTRQATGIVINGKKPKLITHHPASSYELKQEGKDVEYLTITDPDKFWSTSKYLVVEVK
jgi:chromosome segregation ATPase